MTLFSKKQRPSGMVEEGSEIGAVKKESEVGAVKEESKIGSVEEEAQKQEKIETEGISDALGKGSTSLELFWKRMKDREVVDKYGRTLTKREKEQMIESIKTEHGERMGSYLSGKERERLIDRLDKIRIEEKNRGNISEAKKLKKQIGFLEQSQGKKAA